MNVDAANYISTQFRDDEMEKIRRKILRRCKDLEITQSEMARRMGVSRRSVSRWLSTLPTNTYTVGTLCLFCRALNFESLQDFFNY